MKKVKFNIRDDQGKILVRGYTYSTLPDQEHIERWFDSLEFDWKQYHRLAVSYDIFNIEEAAE